MRTLETAPDPTGATAGTSTGLVGLMALQAWVWTASMLPKVTSGAFLGGFARFVGTAPPTRNALYGHVVTPIVLAAPSIFAVGALATELALAATFAVTTVVLVRRRRSVPRRLLVAGAVASLVAAGFALNLALLVGDAAPWRLGDPFDSGVPVEYLLAGLGLVTAVSAITALRTAAGRPQRAERRDQAAFMDPFTFPVR
ncbi:MAG TPA: hypothetical protein VH134_01840 [Candidatus Dormibacteraeota bacterium]|nr:hypothetical protein [Candidatus Dormibacteraeota bacterium]